MDTLVVPTLAARGALDDRSLDVIADDHSYVDELLSDLGDALGVLSFGLGVGALLDRQGQRPRRRPGPRPGRAARARGAAADAARRPVPRAPRSGSSVATETLRAVATGPVRFSLAWLYAHVTEEERMAISPHVPAASRLVWRTRRNAYDRSSVAALG